MTCPVAPLRLYARLHGGRLVRLSAGHWRLTVGAQRVDYYRTGHVRALDGRSRGLAQTARRLTWTPGARRRGSARSR